MNARKRRKMETRRRRRNGWNTTRLSMVLAVLAVCGSCSLFSHTTRVTGGGKFWAVDASTQNSAGYHQPSSNYSLPQCPNKDSSLLCEIADPCVTTMEEQKIEVTHEDDASSSTKFDVDDRFESGDEFFNDFRMYYRLENDALEKVTFEPCSIDDDQDFKTAVDECLSALYPNTAPTKGDCYLTKWGSMNDWDTSKVTNMAEVFKGTNFNGNITEWDTSEVQNMTGMFENTFSFDQDISGWDVSKVESMDRMFYSAHAFNQDITGWNTKDSGGTFEDMFGSSEFADVYTCKPEKKTLCDACGNTCGPPSYWETEAGVCTCSLATCTIQTLKKISEDSKPCKDVSADDGLLQGGLVIDGFPTLTSLDLTGVKIIDGDFVLNGQETLASFSAPDLTEVKGNIIIGGQAEDERNAKLASITFPVLEKVLSKFQVSSNAELTNVSSSKLETIEGELKIDSCTALSTIDLPLLSTSGGIYVSSNKALEQLSLPSLTSNTARLTVKGNENLADISLDKLTQSIGSDDSDLGLAITDNAKLVTIGLTSMQSCSDSSCTGDFGIDISTNHDDVTVLLGTHLDAQGKSWYKSESNVDAKIAFNHPPPPSPPPAPPPTSNQERPSLS